MSFVFPPRPVPSAAIAGTNDIFPIGRVYCVGRNFDEHTREMGKDPSTNPPFFFLKPADAVLSGGGIVPYPPQTKNFQHEIELVVAVGAEGVNVPVDRAENIIFGYAVGLDMTRRDLQMEARESGRPWEPGKTFERSGPLGLIHPATAIGHPRKGAMRLAVNGQVRQQADIDQHVWNVREVIARLSLFYHLRAGDLVFMGTPAGVSALKPGDALLATIDGLSPLEVTIG